ncbi:MAG: hypothetical protein QG626_645 [Patescibacteria group bacterium]|jgi:hypothetical protein|nr:hypothetical protein [Patescibacteria group bacterium]
MALGYLLKIPAVSDYIFEADFDEAVAEIVRQYGLPEGRSEELLELINAILDDVVGVTQLSALLAEAFGLDETKSRLVAADLAGKTILPLAAYLPNIEAEIVALGGKLADYPALRVPKNQRDNLALLKEMIETLDVELTDVLLKRLLFLLQQFVLGEKTEESLRTFFTRSLNIGGLGLTEEQATALLAATLPHAKELASAAASPVGVPTPPAAIIEASGPVEMVRPEPEAKQELEIAPQHELAAEVPVVSAPKTIEPKQVASTTVERKQSVTSTPSTISTAKGEGQSELDPNELKASAKRASVVRKLTASTQSTFASALVTATEMAAPVLKKNKISDKVFADLADKAIRGLRDIYQTRDIVERDWEIKGNDLATVMQAVSAGVDAYQSVATVPSVNSKSVVKDELSDVESQADERFSKLTKADLQAIPQAKAELTVGSTPIMTKDGQRKVVDVVTSARLAGPIEQLGKMSPTEFRRLSSNAAEAGQKIEDLLSTLETTSYEERVKGVLAWRESPMNQLYLQIAEEALTQGLALPEVSSRRRAAGKESLSPAEIKALALLNTRIRF